jgi:predicted amidohydrolase YtcJ
MKNMKKKIGITALLALLGIATYCFFYDFDHDNDIIYYGGDILTMRDSSDKIEAIYVKNGKIIETGSKETIFKLKTTLTQVIDLQGKTLMPGFFDAHGHFDFATIFADMEDISGVKYRKATDVWRIVEEKSKNGKAGEWLFFYGLDPALTQGVETPSLRYLDSIAPDKPIVLLTKALHVFYANSLAFSTLGITDKTPDPSKVSYYERDANGKLTGGIVEQAALEPIRLKLQEIAKKTYLKNTEKVMADYAQYGVTSAVNMGLSNTNKNVLGLYEHIAGQHAKPMFNLLQLIGKLPKRHANSRIFLYLRKEYDAFLPEKIENRDDFFKIIGIKMWYDGSPYVGSMFLRHPYIRSNFTINDIHLGNNHTSESLLKPEELETLIEKYQSKGWQVAIHAQGDRANEEVIGVYEKIHKKQPINAYRHRIEHCMLLPKTAINAVKTMGISPSFHINHLLYYGEFLKSDIIGDERGEMIFPIQSVAEQGIRYSLHADMPQFYPNPLLLASTSVNRLTESGHLINGKERVSVYQALKSITLDAAWQLHLEDKLGSIEKGKYADFVILDKNPLKNAPEMMASIKVLETIVAGNTIWKMRRN